jgi:hypothetical protein
LILKQLAMLAFLISAVGAAAADPPSVAWNRQLGTSGVDQATAVDIDALGNVYVTGRTSGSLDGPNAGGYDLFLRKYDASGAVQWNHQFGGIGDQMSWGLKVDPLGDIVIVGDTRGVDSTLEAFVTKFDGAGNHLWTEPFHDNLGSQALDVDADGLGNLYISGASYRNVGGILGITPDGFVTKFDAAGGRGWTRQFGQIFNDLAWGVGVDASGNVYVSGENQDDVVLSKYDAEGALQWERELATSGYERSHSVAVDDLGNVFIAGNSGVAHGGVNYGRFDALIAKYNSAGELAWVRQTGSSDNDGAARIATDGLGNAYIVGFASANLDGVAFGSRDVLVAKYDASGKRIWQQPLGTPAADNGLDIVVDARGNAYFVGATLGSFGGVNAGSDDAFLLKLFERAESVMTADFDGNGAVNVEDLSIWQSKFGSSGAADADGDADSDGADFLTWQQQLGSREPEMAMSTSVPEPSLITAGLSGVICLFLAGQRRRRLRRSNRRVRSNAGQCDSSRRRAILVYRFFLAPERFGNRCER